MKREKIAIYGSGGFGKELAWLSEVCGFQVICFIDDDENKHGESISGIPVMGIDEAAQNFVGTSVVFGAGDPQIREPMTKMALAKGFAYKTLVHPDAKMSARVKIGEGTIICAGCILTTDIVLGDHVQVNLNCTIGHDVIMGDYTSLAPGVNVSGWVHLGRRVYVGTGAVFVNGTEENPLIIGDDVVIGANACVTKSISAGTWAGVPARELLKNKQ